MAFSVSTSVSLRSVSTFRAQRLTESNRLRSSKFVTSGAPFSRRLRICCEASQAIVAKPETLEKVLEIVATKLATPANIITPESKFSDLGADSLDQVEIVMALEEAFKIDIEESGAESISTVQDAANLIEKVAAEAPVA